MANEPDSVESRAQGLLIMCAGELIQLPELEFVESRCPLDGGPKEPRSNFARSVAGAMPLGGHQGLRRQHPTQHHQEIIRILGSQERKERSGFDLPTAVGTPRHDEAPRVEEDDQDSFSHRRDHRSAGLANAASVRSA